MPLGGCCSSNSATTLENRSRSSAASIESTLVPISGAPASASPRARLSGVWPPNCTITPRGVIRSTMLSTSSRVRGSKNSMSEVSKSVDTVSGLLLIITVS